MEDGRKSPGHNCTSMGYRENIQVHINYKKEGSQGVVCDPSRPRPESQERFEKVNSMRNTMTQIRNATIQFCFDGPPEHLVDQYRSAWS